MEKNVMTEPVRVLGIDLASKRWRDNGSAIVSFTSGDSAHWCDVESGCIRWPEHTALCPVAIADVIEKTVRERGVAGVSLDGPQGWREPDAPKRPGVGRICEYEARCQGKTGEYGKTYPKTQQAWIRFCIELFSDLIHRGRARIVNSIEDADVTSLKTGQYLLLECFPTSTWRASRLNPLPGKSKVGKNISLITQYWTSLQQRYALPILPDWRGSHDDLQAIVAALPAAGLLKGPCLPQSNGIPGKWFPMHRDTPKHWVEGVIWDATPHAEALA